MNNQPLVSILMNCFNGEKYLREAIESVLSQTYQNFEVVFWDNQSTDNSAEIFNSYSDVRLKYFYAPTHTLLCEARNCALGKASGEIIAFLDVDDWWLPHKLEAQVPLFLDAEVGIVCGNYWIENAQTGKHFRSLRRPVPTGWVLNDLVAYYFVGLLTLMVRRLALSDMEYMFDQRYHIVGDLDLVVRLAVDWKLDYVHEPVGCYRLHGSNGSVVQHKRHVEERETWFNEMANVEEIGKCSAFHLIREHTVYAKAMYLLLQRDKVGAFRLFSEMSWSVFRFRLLIALLLPRWFVEKLRK